LNNTHNTELLREYLGIVFEYPKNWITEEQSPNMLLITNTPKKVYGLNGASFELYLVNPGKDPIFPRSDLSLEDIVRNEVKNQIGKKDQFELVGINHITINGIEGRNIEYLELYKNVKSNKIMEYIIITHGILYLMLFSAAIKTCDFYKPQINHILNSIQFIKEK
jgi:PsbP-like protein